MRLKARPRIVDFVVALLDFDLRLQIAFGDAFGRADQPRDRHDQTVGRPQTQPDGGEQHHQRHLAVERREDELHALALASRVLYVAAALLARL